MSFINIKLYFYRNGDCNPVTDIRRLRVPTGITYEDLAVRIKETQNWIQDRVTFKYFDEENDLVQFSSQDEWLIALDSLNEKDDKVLRVRVSAPNPVKENSWRGCGWRKRQAHKCPFFVQQDYNWSNFEDKFAKPFVESLIKNIQRQQTKETKNIPDAQSASIHWGVACDGCDQKNINGDRFKCTECPNFDYCSNCYNTPEMIESHGNHKFIKIEIKSNSQHQHPFAQFGTCHGFDFSKLFNHPLAKQFLQQQGEQAQQFDLSKLVANIQPFINQFMQNLSAEQSQQQTENKSEELKQPQPTEEEIVITEPEVKQQAHQVKQEEPKQTTTTYSVQLEQLISMGFDDVEKVKDLLNRYNGNIDRVVQVLLQ